MTSVDATADVGATSTRARIISAAEALFAERGIDAVSLREINRAAGAKNAVAVQYHFKDRIGVVDAILDKHRPFVDERRHAILDTIEADGGPDVRALTGALVRPLASKLRTDDGGPAYLRIYADLLNRPSPVFDVVQKESSQGSINRWRRLVEEVLDPEVIRLHRRLAAIRFTAAELALRARSGTTRDDTLFVSNLIDQTAAILQAPRSDETARAATTRRRRTDLRA